MHWNIVAILIWRFFVPHIFQLQQEKYDNVVFWYRAKNISSAKKSSRLPLQNKKYQLIHWVTNLKQEKKNSLISIVLDSVWILTPFSLPCKSRGKDERKKKGICSNSKEDIHFSETDLWTSWRKPILIFLLCQAPTFPLYPFCCKFVIANNHYLLFLWVSRNSYLLYPN